MNHTLYTQPQRDIPVSNEVDILVVGAGPAGFAAAVAAARQGRKTMVIEKSGCIGGLMTSGLVGGIPIKWDGLPLIYPVLLREALEQVKNYQEYGETRTKFAAVQFHTETMKYIAQQMVLRAGAEILLETFAVDVIVEGQQVCGVIIENKSGRSAILAKRVIDCTGDADIAFRAGAPVIKGDGNSGFLPVTLMFHVGNVNREVFEANMAQIQTNPYQFLFAFRENHPSELAVWGGSIKDVDLTDTRNITKVQFELREQIMAWFGWMKANAAGFDDAYLSISAAQLGVRETRHIQAKYLLTKADWDQNKEFTDSTGEIHEGKQLPLGCLLPRGIDHLIVAGRSCQVERDIFNPIRLIPGCMLMGQSAAIACALSIESNRPLEDIEWQTYRRKLADFQKTMKD